MRYCWMKSLVFAAMFVICIPAVGQGYRDQGFPEEKVTKAKFEQLNSLIRDAHAQIRAGDDAKAIVLLRQAVAVEDTIPGFVAKAQFELAQVYLRLKKPAEAMEAFRNGYLWNPKRGDLYRGGGDVHFAMEYAILLARQGKPEEAKAMYYYGLSELNPQDQRHVEPVPFLVVFDPEPEGIVWDYDPDTLEAAARMVQALLGGTTDRSTGKLTGYGELVQRVKVLTPYWFYPKLLQANSFCFDQRGAELLAEADALALPGVEKQLVSEYTQDLADLLALNIKNDSPRASDFRPMTRGNERRARMQCLKPNEEVLKRVSIQRP